MNVPEALPEWTASMFTDMCGILVAADDWTLDSLPKTTHRTVNLVLVSKGPLSEPCGAEETTCALFG